VLTRQDAIFIRASCHNTQYGTSAYLIIRVFTYCFILSVYVTLLKYSNHFFVHNFMRIIGVKISMHVTNLTLIVTHVPFADKSKFYITIVLYFVVYVTIGN